MGNLLYFPRPLRAYTGTEFLALDLSEMPQDGPEEPPTASDTSPVVPVPYKPTWTFPEGWLGDTQRLADMLKE